MKVVLFLPAKITDVAQKAGVAVSTVSRVFNNEGRISEETRQRVLQVAQELSYHPRKYQRLGKSVTVNSMCVIYNQKNNVLNNTFYSRIMEEVERVLTSNDYNLIFKTVTGEPERDRQIVDSLLQSAESGFILIGYEIAAEIILTLKKMELPLILIDNQFLDDDVDCVVIDNFYGTVKGINHLLELGHRQIGFVGGPLDHISLNERYLGYQAALSRAGVSRDPSMEQICAPNFGIENGLAAGMALLTRDNMRPSAVFCANDHLAIGVLKAAGQLGIDVPGELSVLGFDDIDFASHTHPPLTTIRVFKEQMGREAAKRLLETLSGNADRPKKEVITTELVIRQSTAKVKSLTEQ